MQVCTVKCLDYKYGLGYLIMIFVKVQDKYVTIVFQSFVTRVQFKNITEASLEPNQVYSQTCFITLFQLVLN